MKNKKQVEYLVDDNPVDISHLSDEEAERIYQERFGDYIKDNESEE